MSEWVFGEIVFETDDEMVERWIDPDGGSHLATFRPTGKTSTFVYDGGVISGCIEWRRVSVEAEQ